MVQYNSRKCYYLYLIEHVCLTVLYLNKKRIGSFLSIIGMLLSIIGSFFGELGNSIIGKIKSIMYQSLPVYNSILLLSPFLRLSLLSLFPFLSLMLVCYTHIFHVYT